MGGLASGRGAVARVVAGQAVTGGAAAGAGAGSGGARLLMLRRLKGPDCFIFISEEGSSLKGQGLE